MTLMLTASPSPTFPGCYSAADNRDELPAKIQEAIEVCCDGDDMDTVRRLADQY